MRNATIYILLIVSFIVFMVTRGEDESNRKVQKEILLSCQDETYYFDETKDILAAQVAGELLDAGVYTLNGSIIEATNLSRIGKYIQEESAQDVIKKIIDGFKKEGSTASDTNILTIQYSIVENDQTRPIKRHDRVYTVVGHLAFQFLLDDELVYEAKTDYIGRTGEDIPRRVECVLNSFSSI